MQLEKTFRNMLVSHRVKSDPEEDVAVPDSTTNERRPNGFVVGEDVYRLEGGQYYLGTIVKVDAAAEKYVVKFMDGTEKPSSLKDLQKFIETNSHCVICKKSKPKTDNEIIECDKCGRGYHQLCHKPHAPAQAVKPGSRWLCSRCNHRAPNKSREARALKKEVKETPKKITRPKLLTQKKLNKQPRHNTKDSLRPVIKMDQIREVSPNTAKSLHKLAHWRAPYETGDKRQVCYCHQTLKQKYHNMLQCQSCRKWFHEKCLQCLTYPMFSGDRFYVFVCKLCNFGKEFVRRLELKWENIVHIALYNLSLQHYKKYFDLESNIVPHINSNWNEFQLPPKIHNCSMEERICQIRSVLAKNVKHFKCGKEIKKRTTIWALREDAPLDPPPISLPKNVPVNDTVLKDNNKSLKFLPPTFKSLASGKSYLFNGQRENTPVPSMIHIMERNGLSSSCSSDTDSKKDNLSITSSQFYSYGYVKKTIPFPTVNGNLQQSAMRRRWKADKGTKGNAIKRRKMKHKGKEVDKDIVSRKARKLVKDAISRPKKDSTQDLPPTPPSSSAPDTPQPSGSPSVSTPSFVPGLPLPAHGDTSGDDNSSRCTLDSFIPPPKDFEGKNNPFHNLGLLSSNVVHSSTLFNSSVSLTKITLPLPLTAVVQHPTPSPQRATKRQLCEKDIRIDRNGDVKRRRLRRTRSGSNVNGAAASKTATIIPGRPGEKQADWNTASARALRSTYANNSPSTSSNSGAQMTSPVDYVLNGRHLRASPRLSSDKKIVTSLSQPSSAISSPVKQSPVAITMDELKSSVNIYFGAANRIAAGEKYTIQAKRVSPAGKVQYLIEWESPST